MTEVTVPEVLIIQAIPDNPGLGTHYSSCLT